MMDFNVLMNRQELDEYLMWVDSKATPEQRREHARMADVAMSATQALYMVGTEPQKSTKPVPKDLTKNPADLMPQPTYEGGSDVFYPAKFDVDYASFSNPGLDETKKILAQMANACGNKNASFRLIEYYAGAGAGLSQVGEDKYGAIYQSAKYLINNPMALRRWANNEDTTIRPS